ncbi:MAG: ATP-binding cassette domain-containing protein [Lachnospiraceae bacterium]|nr:ATP-binding cassette domain-containing protein [Lachnospiraceae bacterium]
MSDGGVNVLKLEGIEKWYPAPEKKNAVHALKGISLELTEGCYGLTGKNGAGKSTLLKILTGFIKPDAGKIYWNGNLISPRSKDYKRLLGYMPQQQSLYETMSVLQFMNYMGVLKAVPKKKLAEETESLLERVHLADKKDSRLGALSGGMKQRLLFAQSLLGSPVLLLLDEPTAGVDPDERVNLHNIIKDNLSGRIVIMSTHIISDIENMAKEEIKLEHGALVIEHKTEG